MLSCKTVSKVPTTGPGGKFYLNTPSTTGPSPSPSTKLTASKAPSAPSVKVPQFNFTRTRYQSMDEALVCDQPITSTAELLQIVEAAKDLMGSHTHLILSHKGLVPRKLIPDLETAKKVVVAMGNKLTSLVLPNLVDPLVTARFLKDPATNLDVLKRRLTPNLLTAELKKSAGNYGFINWPDHSLYTPYTFKPMPANTEDLIASLVHIPGDEESILVIPESPTIQFSFNFIQKEAMANAMKDRKIKYIISLDLAELYHTDPGITEGYIPNDLDYL